MDGGDVITTDKMVVKDCNSISYGRIRSTPNDGIVVIYL